MNPTELLEKLHKEGFGKYKPSPDFGGILRPQQLHALREIIKATFEDNAKVIVLSAPTGSGKSIIAKVFARIMYEIRRQTSNIMTPNRELQKQYGRDLEDDNFCKVVMGSANYRCSLFKDWDAILDDAAHVPVTKALCNEEGALIEGAWSPKIPHATNRIEKEILTAHKDQDLIVLKSIPSAVKSLSYELADSINSSKKTPVSVMKRVCKESKSCSYYLSRTVANDSPAVIRSLHHLVFYILFDVGPGILPGRATHIIDEFHTIESIFRDFESADIVQEDLEKTMASAFKRHGEAKAFEINTRFSSYKASKGKVWTEEDKLYLVFGIEKILGTAIEKFFLKDENSLRKLLGKENLETARDYARSALSGDLSKELDLMHPSDQKLLNMFINIAKYTSERTKARQTPYGVIMETDKLLKVFPVYLHRSKKYFGKENTLLMSATPIPKQVMEHMFDLKDRITYIEIPSDFPPERSPIYFSPVEKITEGRARELGLKNVGDKTFKNSYEKDAFCSSEGWKILDEMLGERILDIANHFPDLAGVIPCNSYKRVIGLKEYLDDEPRFIWITQGDETKARVKEFRDRSAAGESPILVSAGISEGHSFDDEISRLQIIPKMPFPPMNESMKLFMKAYGKLYYPFKTLSTIHQMVGRSMRSKSDYCITIVLDEKFAVVKDAAHKPLCTEHFLDCIQWDGGWKSYVKPT